MLNHYFFIMRLLISFFIGSFLLTLNALGQRPTHVPGPGEPANFFESPVSVVIYIIVPIIIGVFYFVWRKKTRKKNNSNSHN